MPTRASDHRRATLRATIAWGLALAALGLAGPRDAAASACHAPDRPAAGLDYRPVDPAPAPDSWFDLTIAESAPTCRPAPCAGDPAERPGSWDPPVGRLDATPLDAPDRPARRVAAPAAPAVPRARAAGRLERPPRPA